MLLGYGVAGILGNFIAGASAARSPPRTLLTISIVLALAMPAFALIGNHQLGAIALLLVWGLTYGGVSVSLQTWMLKAATDAAEAEAALWVSVFNLSIALGALVGGAVVDGIALAGVLWLACGLFLVSAPIALYFSVGARIPSRVPGA